MRQFRKSPRADFLVYDAVVFFITICTKGHKHYFGQIVDGEMIRSDIGAFLDRQLKSARTYRPNIDIPLHVVMPNHVHAIVWVGDGGEDGAYTCDSLQRSPNPCLRACPEARRYAPELGRYINSLKGRVTKYAKSKGVEFAWQGRYHDHAIRNREDSNNIANYIVNNIAKWDLDIYISA